MAEVNREALEKRREGLQAELNETLAKAQALSGAIQDCNYWLEQLNEDSDDE